ncbi:MAG: hypothetical protein ACLPR9_06500 [Acidimicrobiales bacterium]|jgi:hypothetical protein
MSILDSPSSALSAIIEDALFDEAEVAAAAFLARYSGRTLDAYRCPTPGNRHRDGCQQRPEPASEESCYH